MFSGRFIFRPLKAYVNWQRLPVLDSRFILENFEILKLPRRAAGWEHHKNHFTSFCPGVLLIISYIYGKYLVLNQSFTVPCEAEPWSLVKIFIWNRRTVPNVKWWQIRWETGGIADSPSSSCKAKVCFVLYFVLFCIVSPIRVDLIVANSRLIGDFIFYVPELGLRLDRSPWRVSRNGCSRGSDSAYVYYYRWQIG